MIKNSLIVHTSRDSISYKTTCILGVDQLTRLTIRTDYLYIQIEEMLMEAEKESQGHGSRLSLNFSRKKC
jgi:hypothetical protein